MPFEMSVADSLLVVEAKGRIDDADIRDLDGSLRADPAGRTRHILFDLLEVSDVGPIEPESLRSIAGLAEIDDRDDDDPRRVAVVASLSRTFGLAQVFRRLRRGPLPDLRIFRDRRTALDFLA